MPFPNSLLHRSTWRFLGLSLATTIFSLGTWSLLDPLPPAALLGVASTLPESNIVLSKAMIFLGSRNLCIAASLFWLHYLGRMKEMGVVLCCATVIYVADVCVAVQGRGWDGVVAGLVGSALAATFVGWGLVQGQ
ncbi:hypothetical protein K505DRAFT_236661 [Melanomma pulvis-pyrius CBS 109.77]|uniref:Uncharacterized protein n=1 Tax=Melanomma pulvis-pyrius CBS 109.77 TaxID=1314802 RepID=A0A6A6XKD5_9PLEO|nr:hypothetical protein K505DRAFT_236661 [Melanomma pulvis-pyrius CBS 109.77]